MTEQELISGVMERNREALTSLVETYQKKVIKTAYYFLGNMEDAEDLAQDVFVKITESMPRFRKASSLSTWIYRITVNEALNAVRKNRRKKMFLRMGSAIGIAEPKAQARIMNIPEEQDAPDAPSKLHMLREAVAALPEKQRTVFILNKYEDLPYKEIADITGYSLSAVESLLHRARVNLRKELVKPGIKNN